MASYCKMSLFAKWNLVITSKLQSVTSRQQNWCEKLGASATWITKTYCTTLEPITTSRGNQIWPSSIWSNVSSAESSTKITVSSSWTKTLRITSVGLVISIRPSSQSISRKASSESAWSLYRSRTIYMPRYTLSWVRSCFKENTIITL